MFLYVYIYIYAMIYIYIIQIITHYILNNFICIYIYYIYYFCIYIHTLFQMLLLGPPWCGNGVRLVDLDLPGFEALGTTNTQSGSPESGVDHPMNREIMVS